MNHTQQLAYYLEHGPMTDPRDQRDLLDDLPQDTPALVSVIQGLQVHRFWTRAYGLDLPEERMDAEVNLRPAYRKLARIQELDPAPLHQSRPPERRLVGNCRDFSVLAASFFRHRGIPTRVRCGFGTYFTPGHFEDHWVIEYWSAQSARWVWLDPQLDDLMINALRLPFDAQDMPDGAFVTGGSAWQMIRRGEADPDCFGIFEWKGWDFVKGNLLRDLLALAKFEVLPWDFWGVLTKTTAEMSTSELARLDSFAEICVAADTERAIAVVSSEADVPAPLEWAD